MGGLPAHGEMPCPPETLACNHSLCPFVDVVRVGALSSCNFAQNVCSFLKYQEWENSDVVGLELSDFKSLILNQPASQPAEEGVYSYPSMTAIFDLVPKVP